MGKEDSPDTNGLKFKYSMKEKALIISLSLFTFLFIYLIFGPIDIFANNCDEYIFSFGDFIGPLLLLFITFFMLLFVIMMFFKGMGINIITSLMLTFIIYGYIDGIFINNIEFPGGDVSGDISKYRVVTEVVFFILMEILLIVSLLSRKNWKKVIIFSSILFVGMNLSGLVADVVTNDINKEKIQGIYVESRKDILKVSEKENIIFIIFDRFDTDYYKEVIGKDPTFFDDLEGFTYYDNYITHYLRTFPSATYMVTNEEYKGEQSAEDYLATSYKQSKFLKDLKDNGYNIRLYGEKHYTYINAESMLGIVDNIEPIESIDSNGFDIAIYLSNLSFYRNFSYFISMQMIYDTNHGVVEKLSKINCEDGIYKTEDDVLYGELCENGLSFSGEDKNYIYIHLKGSHAPYNIDENCQKVEKSTPVEQTKGAFLAVKKYLNELKRLGVYDNSTIIITGDHGKPYTDIVPITEWEKEGYTKNGQTVAMFYKPRNSKNDKLEYSSAPVQSSNIIPSIVKDAKIATNNEYSYSIEDIENGAKQDRVYMHMVYRAKKRKIMFDVYDVLDDATDLNNWKFRERIETNYTWY